MRRLRSRRQALRGVLSLFLLMALISTCSRQPPTSDDHNPPPQEYDPRNISRTETHSSSPSLDVRGEVVAVAWSDSIQGNNWDIMYREREEGTWGEILNISNTEGLSLAPQVAIDVYGNVHVVWEEDQTKIFYRFKDTTGVWHPKTILSEGHLPQIQADENGTIHLLWVGASGGLEYQPKTPRWMG